MNHIEKQYFKEIEDLDAASFFLYLVKEGCRLSLMSSAELESLQLQIVELLTEQFNRWTGGQSSSVSVETGQRIHQSVFYSIGYFLKSLPDAECALEVLKGNPLNDLFLRGKKRMEEDLREARKLLLTIQEDCFETDVFAYNDTLSEGLPMFFSSYDMDYGSHETPASIDYPLSSDKMDLTGIDYIYSYLRKLKLENDFCGHFSDEEIHRLLRGYDRQYKELLFNIFDLVLNNAVGSLLLGREGIELPLSDCDRLYLQRYLAGFPAGELDGLLDETVSWLCGRLSLSDASMTDYISTSAVKLKSRLKNALEAGSLNHLFLSAEEETEEPVIRFEDNAKLGLDSFRKLADEIRDCRFVSDKIALLNRKPLGMADLTDLLDGSCFFCDEFQKVFESLEEVRLALLAKKLSFDPDGSGSLSEEDCPEWQSRFNTFLTQMDPVRKASILALADRIEASMDR